MIIIDMWKMDGKKHEFGLWYDSRKAYAFALGKTSAPIPPNKILALPLVNTPLGKNYPENPSSEEYNEFINHCLFNPADFKYNKYLSYIRRRR